MRDLIVSTIIVVVLIGGWLFFENYSENSIDSMSELIHDEIISAVENEDWENADDMMAELQDRWDKYKDKALLFLNSGEISEIESVISKTREYVKAKDVSNSSGELNALADQIDFLTRREKINVENIL